MKRVLQLDGKVKCLCFLKLGIFIPRFNQPHMLLWVKDAYIILDGISSRKSSAFIVTCSKQSTCFKQIDFPFPVEK